MEPDFFGGGEFEITFYDSLQEFLTFSRGKTDEKNFGDQIWDKGAKIGPETSIFALF